MSQEPGSHQEILDFVKDKYNSKFILFEKVEVNGPKAHPLFQYLRNHGPLFDPKTNTAKVIPWNFAKFLVNGQGEVVRFFMPGDPISDIRKAVEELIWFKKEKRYLMKNESKIKGFIRMIVSSLSIFFINIYQYSLSIFFCLM